jgi:hypothetical protein
VCFLKISKSEVGMKEQWTGGKSGRQVKQPFLEQHEEELCSCMAGEEDNSNIKDT